MQSWLSSANELLTPQAYPAQEHAQVDAEGSDTSSCHGARLPVPPGSHQQCQLLLPRQKSRKWSSSSFRWNNHPTKNPQSPPPHPPSKNKCSHAGSCPGRTGITFTLLRGLCQQFHTIATRWAFLHIRFRVPFHLEEAVTSPFAAWYLSEISNPNTLERDNAFLFLKIALHLHRGGLVSSQERSAD